ncbi:hypothetical protein DL764_008023 [Monosporascus ibericus]|uniref:Uncharacterized protein n=1 Tax=Monosporascus ibericus TaxID=155417 RepID=A0A4Q4SYL2_9PEZI|nr:hypothetical protein DL764_008023 [Monosporascus ibericus]
MCFVTRLACQVCKAKDKYLFHPCASLLETEVNPADQGPLPQGKHFYCPELEWPLPEEPEGTSHHICDFCLRNGVLYYQRTVAIQQDTVFNERHHELLYNLTREGSAEDAEDPNFEEADDQEAGAKGVGANEEDSDYEDVNAEQVGVKKASIKGVAIPVVDAKEAGVKKHGGVMNLYLNGVYQEVFVKGLGANEVGVQKIWVKGVGIQEIFIKGDGVKEVGIGKDGRTGAEPETTSAPHVPKAPRLFPHASEIKGRFPPNWDEVNPRFKAFIVRMYCRDKDELQQSGANHWYPVDKDKSFENHWQPRLADEPYRELTLWIPCCTICKKPSFTADGGIDGVEFEPSAIFWRWLCRLQGEKMIATRLRTGFIHKPCETCVNLEFELRQKVSDYLGACETIEAWAVWNWLMMRGTGWVDFWNHESTNVGLPDAEPYPQKYFMRLMAEGWKAKSGLPWEDTVDLDPPVSCTVAMNVHEAPLLRLSQWNKLAGVVGRPDPVFQPPAPEPALAPAPAGAHVMPAASTRKHPEKLTVRVRNRRQWTMLQAGTLADSHGWLDWCGKKRYITVMGAMIDEQGRAVKAINRAPDPPSPQQKAVVSQTILLNEHSAGPVQQQEGGLNQKPVVNGDPAGAATSSRKRRASNGASNAEAKRVRFENASPNGYASPPKSGTYGDSPHPIKEKATASQASSGIEEDGGDLFGDRQFMDGVAESVASPSQPATQDPSEGIFTSCVHGFYHLNNGMSPQDRWSLDLGVKDDEEEG